MAPILPLILIGGGIAALFLFGGKASAASTSPGGALPPGVPETRNGVPPGFERLERESPETFAFVRGMVLDSATTAEQFASAGAQLQANGFPEAATMLGILSRTRTPESKSNAMQQLSSLNVSNPAMASLAARALSDVPPQPSRRDILGVAQILLQPPAPFFDLGAQLVRRELELSMRAATPTAAAPATSVADKVAAALASRDPNRMLALAAELDATAPNAAADLRRVVAELQAPKAPIPVGPITPTAVSPGLPQPSASQAAAQREAEIKAAIARATSPEALEALANTLRGGPFGNLADMALARAAELRSVLQTATALQETEKILNPATPPAAPPSLTVPPVVTPAVTQPTPAASSLPLPATPAGPAPKPPLTPLQVKTKAVSDLIKKSRKFKEDKILITNWQREAGLSGDGLFGPGSAEKMAELGISDLPIVWYWPKDKKAAVARVGTYKRNLESMAAQAAAAGDTVRATELRESARRDNGQGKQLAE